MAPILPPRPVWPYVGVLAADEAALGAARESVAGALGPALSEAGPFPFRHTGYYARQAGPSILRVFFGLAGPVSPEWLAEAKTRTNGLEEALARRLCADAASPCPWPRPVNLDPGYVALSKTVLASAKDFWHRVPLRDGVYAEVTLRWRRGAEGRSGRWEPLPWTFPDYAEERYHPFLSDLRDRLRRAGSGGLP